LKFHSPYEEAILYCMAKSKPAMVRSAILSLGAYTETIGPLPSAARTTDDEYLGFCVT